MTGFLLPLRPMNVFGIDQAPAVRAQAARGAEVGVIADVHARFPSRTRRFTGPRPDRRPWLIEQAVDRSSPRAVSRFTSQPCRARLALITVRSGRRCP